MLFGMLFPLLSVLLVCCSLFLSPVRSQSEDIYPLVLEELYSKPAEARYHFCQQTRFTAVYSTGVYYKAILREDDTSLLKLGKAISRTRAFIFKFNPYSGAFIDHQVTLEGSTNKMFHDFVAFAGVHLDLFNRTTDLFVEMLRKVQLHTRDNVFQQNQVAFAASRILASKHIALDDHYAEKDLWNLCSIGAFNESGCCLTISSGKCAPNKLFPEDLIRLASPEDYYALLFIKQKNILVLIRSVPEQRDGYDRQYWTVRYHHVSLTDSDADVANSWKVGRSPAELLDYRVIGAIEHYKRYYLVTVNYEEALQLRKITDYSDFPLKLAEAPIDFHHFFHCRAVDFAQYYQTMVNAVVVVFCCGSYWVCRKAADYQRQLKPMAKGAVGGSGKKTMMMTAAGRRRRLRPTADSEKQKIASQYLWRAGATDKYYVDEGRLQRDERRVCASIAHMAKLMLHTADMDQLKEKIAKRKAGAKERRMG